MAGTGLYWGRGETELRALAEALRIPVFVNGLGRGCFPADHELYFSRARSEALKQADVALVIGVPLDFRLGLRGCSAPRRRHVAIDVAEPQRAQPRALAAELYGALPATLDGLRSCASPADDDLANRATAAGGRRCARSRPSSEGPNARASPTSASRCIPCVVYSELLPLLDRDAIVIGDGGDFVSFAGRLVDSFEPGCWLDPGPYGCLGSGPGYALAAKLAHPDRQVVLLQGDGAFGFAGMDWDTLVRHGVAVIGVMGNNGIWALEKHPMEMVYGYSVAADLQPELRYDQVVSALGGHGELVRSPGLLRPAFERALASGKPALINVLTDPTDAGGRLAAVQPGMSACGPSSRSPIRSTTRPRGRSPRSCSSA